MLGAAAMKPIALAYLINASGRVEWPKNIIGRVIEVDSREPYPNPFGSWADYWGYNSPSARLAMHFYTLAAWGWLHPGYLWFRITSAVLRGVWWVRWLRIRRIHGQPCRIDSIDFDPTGCE